jgi:glutathione S-transferase
LGTQYRDFGEASRLRAVKALHWLNDEIEDRKFLASEQYSMADIVALTMIDFATFIGIDTPPELTHLSTWHARVSARPSAAA